MATRMLQRRGTAAEWAAANPVLAGGEVGFETDTKVMKMGDGVTPWDTLDMPWVPTAGGAMSGPLSLIAPTQNAHAARKQDVDARVAKSGDTMSGPLSLIAPTQNAHAVRKVDLDSAVQDIEDYVDLGWLVAGDTVTTHRASMLSIPASSLQTSVDLTGAYDLLGGTIIGSNAGFRITVDGIVVLISNNNAHGEDFDGTPFSVLWVPPARSYTSLKVETVNVSNVFDRDYGVQLYTRART